MPKDIIEGKVAEASIARVSQEHVDRLTQHHLLPGDIVYGRRGDIGRQALITERESGWLCGTGCLRITPGDAAVDSTWLHYYLREEKVIKFIAQQAVGATMPNLNTSILRSIPITFPDKATQRRVAAILSAYDDLIENNTRRIAILEEMARRIYEEWFVRFRFPGHENVRMVESELGLVPEGWEVSTLGDVCKRLKSGGTPSRSNNDYWAEGTVDWFKTKELWDGFLFESEEKISEQAIADRKTSVYQAGTILMAIYGSPTVGRMGITTRRSTCNQAALGFEPDEEKITKWFLFHTLYGLRQEFNNKAQGAAQQNISKEKVAETAFIKPPLQVMTAFEQVAEPIWSMLRNLQTKNRNLRTTRDLLLPKLISGELDVSHLPEPEAMAA
jgi:type I restriction enzyme S subunit